MRTMRRNQTPFWYCPYIGSVPGVDSEGFETGEPSVQYGEPVRVDGNVSPAGGAVLVEQFGNDLAYDRVIVLEDPMFPMKEGDVLFIETFPKVVDGVPQYNYVVKKAARSLNSVSYAIKQVDVS